VQGKQDFISELEESGSLEGAAVWWPAVDGKTNAVLKNILGFRDARDEDAGYAPAASWHRIDTAT